MLLPRHTHCLFIVFVLFLGEATLYAQTPRIDTVSLRLYFPLGESDIRDNYADNEQSLTCFAHYIDSLLSVPGSLPQSISVRAGASPEGSTSLNEGLSVSRAHSLDSFWNAHLRLIPPVRYNAVGEDWESLESAIERLSVPWKEEALTVIRETPLWVTDGKTVVDSRKNRLRSLQDGVAWSYLEEHVFPLLRSVSVESSFVTSTPAKADTVHRVDTVFVPVPVPVSSNLESAPKKVRDLSGKKMLFAVRTNALAIPFANIGLEVPLGRHFSVGADWYYPWIWRQRHSEGLDYSGSALELLALDLEARYWFGSKNSLPQQRLLGHSVGLYAVGGYYDFERNASGHQGEFYNLGIDYLFAFPLWGGRLHMEVELGIGFIHSMAQPYDNFEQGGKCYRRKGIRQEVNWFGPTRAQISLVLPIYIHSKGGAR